ncbi:MAG: type II 3-dehydroquinate dehydratase [Desulfobacteraceae bacterium]|nr:type II 3-dehydroquinate dehydratase [Desulfobacteraceae bacterium]
MPSARRIARVCMINGPNLNLLGSREPEIYGRTTLDQIHQQLIQQGKELGLEVESFQSNHEGAIVDRIQKAAEDCDALIINPAAYTHTSVAIRDALAALAIPVVEIHLSNLARREAFRQRSLVTEVVSGHISGFGADGYRLALEAVSLMLRS